MITGTKFADTTNATVAFDHSDNFYVVSQGSDPTNETGEVYLEKYSFTVQCRRAICSQTPPGPR